MKIIWVVTNHAFMSRDHVLASLHITFSSVEDVSFDVLDEGGGDYSITATRPNGESELFHVKRVELYDAPAHL